MRVRIPFAVGVCCMLFGSVSKMSQANPGKQASDAPAAGATSQPAELPPAIAKLAANRFPAGTVDSFEKQDEGQRHLFFVKINRPKGPQVTLLASGIGQYLGMVEDDDDLTDNETFIDPETAPQHVKDAIAKAFRTSRSTASSWKWRVLRSFTARSRRRTTLPNGSAFL